MIANDMMWWVTAIELPAMSGLFYLLWRGKQESEAAILKLREMMEARSLYMREALASFRLEVAKNYASVSAVKELEMRLVSHLLRIEAKLDTTAMKTEALQAGRNNQRRDE